MTIKGDAIMDYSIYDALLSGFNKVVFIVRKEIKSIIEERYKNRIPEGIAIYYVIQEVTNVPKPYIVKNRIKPWGTGHALWSVKDIVNEPFAIINADDFYGRDAFLTMSKALEDTVTQHMIGYQLKNTLSPHGTVSRGECYVTGDNNLDKVIERTAIALKQKEIQYYDAYKKETKAIAPETIVSMNFWGCTPVVFDYAEQEFKKFLSKNKDDAKAEFYLPSIINNGIKENLMKCKVWETTSKWFGVTYKEDKEVVVNTLQQLIEEGIYPEDLWNGK